MQNRSTTSDADLVHFVAMYVAFQDIIEKYGPEVFGVDQDTVYTEEIEGISLHDYIATKVNPWTPEGERFLQQVVQNTLHIVSSMSDDGFCAPTDFLGYIVQPDLSVRQVNFETLSHTGPNSCTDLDDFRERLRGTLALNSRLRVFNLIDSDATLTQQMFAERTNIDAMIANLMPGYSSPYPQRRRFDDRVW